MPFSLIKYLRAKKITTLFQPFQVYNTLYKKDTLSMEENLINQCRQMHRASQKQVYELLAPRFYLVCKRYLKKEEEIEEALADAFYTIFTKINQLKENLAFEGWAKKIVVNQCLLTIRKTKDYNVYLEDVSIQPLAEHSNETFLEEEDLLKLLNYLPEGAKTIFVLYAIEGYSHKEIAEQLGISEGTSKSQLNVSRTKLKELIEMYYNQKPESYGNSK
jgi:RNA polymerase sigma factor (sigma-70 family)